MTSENTTYALEIDNLTKVYDNGFTALKGINLKIKEGDFFALLGHNGAGKSTTINIVSSIIKKSGGKVKIFGKDLDTDLAACKALIGVVPQEPTLMFGISLLELLIYQGGYYGIPHDEAKRRAIFWLQKMDLWDKHQATVRELSGGMVRRFMIAKALMHSPKLLILDEPTAGVDVTLRRDMWHFLQEINALGITIILTTHYLEEAEYLCRNIAIIKSGQIQVNTSMKALITSLDDDLYTLDVTGYQVDKHGEPEATKLNLEGCSFKVVDKLTLEVAIDRSSSLSKCFSYLESQGISVISMRNSQNRLERIFVEFEERGASVAS